MAVGLLNLLPSQLAQFMQPSNQSGLFVFCAQRQTVALLKIFQRKLRYQLVGSGLGVFRCFEAPRYRLAADGFYVLAHRTRLVKPGCSPRYISWYCQQIKSYPEKRATPLAMWQLAT